MPDKEILYDMLANVPTDDLTYALVKIFASADVSTYHAVSVAIRQARQNCMNEWLTTQMLTIADIFNNVAKSGCNIPAPNDLFIKDDLGSFPPSWEELANFFSIFASNFPRPIIE